MMQHIKGDLVKAIETAHEGGPQIMMHVCNNCGVMGSGIALQVKQRLPDAYYAYQDFEAEYDGLPLGTISYSDNVINLHAQDGYGRGIRHLDYEALYQSLEKAAVHIARCGIERVGVPYRMGSDRAGGDWGVVLAMLEAVFAHPNVKVLIYQL